MLDLAKPLGVYEGLIFYGDHEINDLVYYFPDEVSLAPQHNPDGSTNPFYELFFQIFSEGDVVEGSIEDLRKTAGSVLSLGIQCTVTPARLQKALDQVKESGNLPETLSASPPPWRDGNVNLIVLDADNSKNETMSNDAFVKSIVGSNKPSLLSGDLKSVFNVRLDRRGTSLIQAALDGDTGNVAGVLYDLKFNAIRPALNMRIWANLDRCYESVSQQLGIKAEFVYAGIKFSLGAELGWLTKKLEEDGNLKVDVLSQAEDAQTKQMMDEMVKDFKDSVLKEMFQPYVNPQIPAAGIGAALQTSIPSVGVTYRFTKENITQNKILEVDYRERSAVVRTHNPQSHLWVFGKQIGANKNKYIQKIIFSDVWKEQSLNIKMVYDFADPKADLLSTEVVIWRFKHGLAVAVKEGRFSMPEGVDPIKSLTFHKEENEKKEIAWLCDRDEPIGYYYQIRFVYSGKVADVSSPSEIIIPPVFSTSEDLVIFPDTYTFYKNIEVREGNISFDELKSVDISLRLKDESNIVLDVEMITINADIKKETWSVRGKDKKNLFVEATREYHYKDERPSISTEPVYLQDDELIINKPFLKSGFSLIPVIAGRGESVSQVLLEITVISPGLDQPLKTLYRFAGPQFDAPEIHIPLNSDKDVLSYDAKAIMQDARVIYINNGTITTNALIIDLNRININEVTFIWQGRSPTAAGIKSLKIELRKTGNEPTDLEGIEYTGDGVPAPVTKTFPATDNIEWRITKRFDNGSKEKGDFKPLTDKQIIISTG